MNSDALVGEVATPYDRPTAGRPAHLLTEATTSPLLSQRLWFAASSLLFCLVLSWSYAHVESKLWFYAGAIYNPPFILVRIASFSLAVLPAFFLSPQADRPSSVALCVFYLLVYIPFALIAPHVLTWPSADVLMLEAYLLLNLALMQWLARCPRRRFASIVVPKGAYLFLLAIITIGLSLLTAAMNGFNVDLSVADVYTRRLAARETVAAGSPIGYAIAILSGSLIPISLVLGVTKRNVLLVGAALIGVVAIFSLAGQKSVLLTPVLILGTYGLVRWAARWFAAVVCVSMAVLVAIADIVALWYGNTIPSALISFRLLAAAGINMSRYFEFFSENPYYLLSGGLLRFVLVSPYDRPMTMMMGARYDPSELLNLNSNVWATAFGDGGYVAVLLSSILIGIILWVFDCWAHGPDSLAFCSFGGFLGFLFAAMALPSVFLTGGLIPTMVLLYLLLGTTPRHDKLLSD